MADGGLFDLEYLREIRRRSGMTQGQVADRIGMARESWNRIEHGQRRLDPDYLPALCDALDCSCAELLVKYGALFREPRMGEAPVYSMAYDGGTLPLSSDEYAMLRLAAEFAGVPATDPELACLIAGLVGLRRRLIERTDNE